jgi:hypothetical protein
MEALLMFVGVLLALTPLVIAVVNAALDDMPGGPRWFKRLLSVFAGILVSVCVAYLGSLYAEWMIPLPVVLIAGVCLGLNACGVYDFGKLIGTAVPSVQRE